MTGYIVTDKKEETATGRVGFTNQASKHNGSVKLSVLDSDEPEVRNLFPNEYDEEP